MKSKLPHTLLLLYVALFIFLSISPVNRTVWWAENITIIIIVIPLVLTHKKFIFSNTAYICMYFLIILHTIGGHFTFEHVPFGFITDLFNFKRNHYDRLAHFTVGFYAFPIAELLLRKRLTSSRTILYLFPVFSIFSIASVYEIIEWLAVLISKAESGIAFLSAQGDIWDAQKDMLADGLGAIFIMFLFYFLNKHAIGKLNKPTKEIPV